MPQSELFPVVLSVTPDQLLAALGRPPSSLGTAGRVDPFDTHAVTALRS